MKYRFFKLVAISVLFLGAPDGWAQTINTDNLFFPDFTLDSNGDLFWYGGDNVADVKMLYDDTSNLRTVSVYSLAGNTYSSVRMLSNTGNTSPWLGHAEAVVYMSDAVNAGSGENWDRISYTTGNQGFRKINMIQVESGLQGENPSPLLFTMSKPDIGYYIEAMRMDQEGLMVFGLTQDIPREIMVLDQATPDSQGMYDSHYMAFEGNPAVAGWQMNVDVTSDNGESKFVFGALNGSSKGVGIVSVTDQGDLQLPADIYLTEPGSGIIVHSFGGLTWRVTVDNGGNLSAQSYVASNTPAQRPETLTDGDQPIIHAVTINADTVNLPKCSIDNRGMRQYGGMVVGQALGDTDGSVGIFAEGANATLLYKIGTTQGDLPTTGPVSELAFYPNKNQSGNFSRMALTAMAEGAYRIEQEAGGTEPVAVLEYHTDRADYINGAWEQTLFAATAMRVSADGTCKFGFGRNFKFGPIPISDLGFYLKCPDPTSTGTKDSHSVGWHGKSHDGVMAHDVLWRAKVNVTSQAGESGWTLTQQIDGAAESEKFRVADDGRVSLTGDAVVTNFNFGLVLRSPNGNHWRVTVDNNGVFQTTSINKTPPFAYNDLSDIPLNDEKPIALAADLFLDFLDMPKFDIDATGTMTWFGEPVSELSDVSMSQNPAYLNGILLQSYNTVIRTSHDLLPSTSVPAAGARTEFRLYRTQDETVNAEYVRFFSNALSGARNEFRIQVEAKGSGRLYPLSNTVSKPSAGFFEEAFRVTTDGRVVFGGLRTSPKDVVGLYHWVNPAEDHFAVWQGKSHDGFSVHEVWWRAYAPVDETRFIFQHQLDDGGFADQMAITIGGEVQLRGDLHLSSPGKGIQLRSPNGQYWRLAVNNSGQPGACQTGDLDGDCVVDEMDIELLASAWLDTGTTIMSGPDNGTVWDAALDWNRTLNPSGHWSYRNGNMISPNFADVCINGTAHCGQPLNWVYPGEPLAAYDNCAGVDSDEFLAHGPYLQRWTSDFIGTVKVNGTLWQVEGEPTRQMRFLLQHNGVYLTEVAVGWSSQTLLDGKANTVTLTLSGNPDIEINVQPGDTIDCILDGAGPNGNGVNTSVGCHFSVTVVNSGTVFVPPLYDLVPDNIINHLDFSVMAENWLLGQ